MLRYFVKRLVYALLVLVAVSLLTFFMSTVAPGDRVDAHLRLDSGQIAHQQKSFTQRQIEYTRIAERLGLHLPQFYFSIHPLSFPDSLHKIVRKDERYAVKQMLLQHGDWRQIREFRKHVQDLIIELGQTEKYKDAGWTGHARNDLEFLLTAYDMNRIDYLLNSISETVPDEHTDVKARANDLAGRYQLIRNTRTSFWQFLPKIAWYGLKNQYHMWMRRTVSGDFGTSLIDGRPVQTKISEALRWTLSINIAAILLAFGIAIPLGVMTARKAGHVTDKIISTVLFALYAIPSFWLAMLCIIFLTTPQYASWLDLFPTGGVGRITDTMSAWERFGIRVSHLTLPVICAAAGSLAYLTRQMRGGMLRELRQDYIRMVRAKGLSERQVHWRHAFRNALFPMITILGSAFPAAISGTVILEVIFSIPGMGRLLYMSIMAKDWPVVYAMVLLAACLTIIGYFIADLLYRRADPRVELKA